MYRPDSLRPWKQMFDNSLRQQLSNSQKKLVEDRHAINLLLSESTSKLQESYKNHETIKRLSAPMSHRPTYEAVLNFAFSGEPTTFDVLPISSPCNFLTFFHFDIAFLNELVPFCLISLERIFKDKNFYEKPLRSHNIRMASEIQTFIASRKDLYDIAKCRLRLNDPDCKISAVLTNRIFEEMNKTLGKINAISFEESVFLRFYHINKSVNVFTYNSTPNDYLFSQRLAMDYGLDLELNAINISKLNDYLISQCPVKSNFEKFDFLRHLFINKSVLDLPYELRAIQIFNNLDSLRVGFHGIIDALSPEEKASPNPIKLYKV